MSITALVGGVLIGAPAAQAAAVPVAVGYRGHSHAGTTAPTADKPQSKLWFHDGRWWGVLFRPSARGGRFTIHQLDRATQTWVDTAVAVDTRENVHLDALSLGNKLYVASSRGTSKRSLDRKVRVLAYTYDAGSKSYTGDRGFPVEIADGDVEAVVIDRDSTGTLWATFVLDGRVMVTHTRGAATRWVAPYVLPVGAAAHVRPEPEADQSAIVRFGGNRVGVMFSNQVDRTGLGVMYWAVHTDGTSDRSWTLTEAFSGRHLADEHINLKALPNGDRAGLVLAAVKTSLRAGREEQTAVHTLRLRADGTWTSHRFGTVTDNHTRPLVQVDIDSRKVYVFATSPCCRGGVIYMKVSSLDDLSFPAGKGTPFIKSTTDEHLNNPTGTKQTVGHASGLVVLAGDAETVAYLHNDTSITASVSRPLSVSRLPPAAPGPGVPSEPGGTVGGAPAPSPAGSSGPVASAVKGVTVSQASRPQRGPTLVPAVLTRRVNFGWFSEFMAFTGADTLMLVNAATAALFGGFALVVAARRRVRRPPGTASPEYAEASNRGVQT